MLRYYAVHERSSKARSLAIWYSRFGTDWAQRLKKVHKETSFPRSLRFLWQSSPYGMLVIIDVIHIMRDPRVTTLYRSGRACARCRHSDGPCFACYSFFSCCYSRQTAFVSAEKNCTLEVSSARKPLPALLGPSASSAASSLLCLALRGGFAARRCAARCHCHRLGTAGCVSCVQRRGSD